MEGVLHTYIAWARPSTKPLRVLVPLPVNGEDNNRVANGADDRQRTDIAMLGIVGKRLTYKLPYVAGEATHA